MSFLTILLIASAFYFAHARPDSPTQSEMTTEASNGNNGAEPAKDPPESDASVIDPKVIKQLHQYFSDISANAEQKYIKVKKQQDDFNKEVASFVKYFLLLTEEKYNENGGDAQTEDHGESLMRNEMILHFESTYTLELFTPHGVEVEDEEEEYEYEEEK